MKPWKLVSLVLFATLAAHPAHAFTQCGGNHCGVTPMGHEALVSISGRLAASYVNDKANHPKVIKFLNSVGFSGNFAAPDLLKQLGAEKRLSYGSHYEQIFAAVMGQRFVDTAGFPVISNKKCFAAVSQDQEAVQPDHFLRKTTDIGLKGAQDALAAGKTNFIRGLEQALLVKDETVAFTDGGATSSNKSAQLAGFLLGRPLHLLQDSYSPEHALRDTADAKKVLDLHTYLCTPGAWQHTHTSPLYTALKHGDMIYKNYGTLGRKSSFKVPEILTELNPGAYNATRASAKVWLAFMAFRSLPTAQQTAALAKTVATHIGNIYFQDSITSESIKGQHPGLGVRLAESTDAKALAACEKALGLPDSNTKVTVKCLKSVKANKENKFYDEYLLMPIRWTSTRASKDSILHDPQLATHITTRFSKPDSVEPDAEAPPNPEDESNPEEEGVPVTDTPVEFPETN